MIARIAAHVLSLVPGLGHVVLGRCARGVFLFFLAVMFLNGAFLAPYLARTSNPTRFARGCLGAAGLVWAYTLLDVFHITYWRRRKAFERKKRELYFEVHQAFAGHRLEDARRLLKRLVRMDPEEPAGHYYLGLVYRALGRRWRARKRFQQALWVDPEKRFKADVQRQLAGMKGGRT